MSQASCYQCAELISSHKEKNCKTFLNFLFYTFLLLNLSLKNTDTVTDLVPRIYYNNLKQEVPPRLKSKPCWTNFGTANIALVNCFHWAFVFPGLGMKNVPGLTYAILKHKLQILASVESALLEGLGFLHPVAPPSAPICCSLPVGARTTICTNM